MAKKRKTEGKPFGHGKNSKTEGESTKLSIKTFEDVADSEDEFHVNRDKILLEEGPVHKRQRRVQERDEFLEPSDEEVLAESDQPSSSEDDFEDAEEVTAAKGNVLNNSGPRKAVQDSDSDDSADSDENEDAGGWGASKRDYYNADVIETEADALEEEAEARRLQQKQLQDMTEADFGFDEVDWREVGKDGEEDDLVENGIRREVLPRLEVTDAMGPEERMKIMRTRYPEFEPLAKEFLDLQGAHEELSSAAAETLSKISKEELVEVPTPVAALKHRALSAYLASLSMYFALLTSGAKSPEGQAAAMPPEELREHTVMETLVQCRDLWKRVKDIPILEPSSDFINSNDAILLEYAPPKDKSDPPKPVENGHTSKHHTKRVRKAERLALAAQAEAEARRAERLRQTEESLASLSALTAPSSKHLFASESKKSSLQREESSDSNSDFGDATTLTAHELAEKARRKRSLKFYTSQIAQKSNKRANAGGDAGGDADIPHRERLKDRQERLNAEAERRGKKPKDRGKGAPLGEADSGDSGADGPTNAQRAQPGDGSGSEDYYDLIASRSASKKTSKASRAQAEAAVSLVASGAVVNPNDLPLEADGKRGITYAIQKNKGLHPHRKKEVRNPRVKKRKKFEERKKKLGSVRAVYKGEREGKGGYGGEKTGIKGGLVRSVKL